MPICQNCGRPLREGEVCPCRTPKPNPYASLYENGEKSKPSGLAIFYLVSTIVCTVVLIVLLVIVGVLFLEILRL